MRSSTRRVGRWKGWNQRIAPPIGYFCWDQWIFQVPVKGGRDYITSQKAIYKWYILLIGRLYTTYHLLGEPETTIDGRKCGIKGWGVLGCPRKWMDQ